MAKSKFLFCFNNLPNMQLIAVLSPITYDIFDGIGNGEGRVLLYWFSV